MFSEDGLADIPALYVKMYITLPVPDGFYRHVISTFGWQTSASLAERVCATWEQKEGKAMLSENE